MKLKHLVLTLATALTTLTSPVHSNTIDKHNELWFELIQVGVDIQVNPALCTDDTRGGGFYASGRDLLVICQDKGVYESRPVQAQWTDNDLDTLRHEAIHVVQDCVDNELNGRLDSILNDEMMDELMVKTGTTKARLFQIMRPYIERGLSPQDLRLEAEAWLLASVESPELITAGVRTFCEDVPQ